MEYSDLPKEIADDYLPKEIQNCRITSKRGESVYIIFLKNGLQETWKYSNRLGWYKTTHQSGPHKNV